MAKKRKSDEKKNKRNIIIIIVSALLVISIVVIGLQLKLTPKETSNSSTPIDNSLRRGETRPTLSPSMFNDPFVAEAYQIAKDIPHVLDSLICYCLCDRPPFNHKSLLSCFVDEHGAG
jgi:hypothetical protein